MKIQKKIGGGGVGSGRGWFRVDVNGDVKFFFFFFFFFFGGGGGSAWM